MNGIKAHMDMDDWQSNENVAPTQEIESRLSRINVFIYIYMNTPFERGITIDKI